MPSNLNKIQISLLPTLPIKWLKIDVRYYRSGVHVQLMQISMHSNWQVWWNQLMYSTKYCFACLYPNTILMQVGLTTVLCPATDVSKLICKSSASARIKQSVIYALISKQNTSSLLSQALEVETRLGGNLYL